MAPKPKGKRAPAKNLGGRPVIKTICPTCSKEDTWYGIYRHIRMCPENPDDHMLITIREWLDSINHKLYVCPVGCGEKHAYREMLKHIPKCEKQDEVYPYTAARWRKHLIETQTQPGAEIAAQWRSKEVRTRTVDEPDGEAVKTVNKAKKGKKNAHGSTRNTGTTKQTPNASAA